jgi:hypothetical protein
MITSPIDLARAAALTLLLLGIAGCVYVPSRYSTLECTCTSPTAPRFVLTVYAPTGAWGVGGHSLGIYRETGVISIALPSPPTVASRRYDTSELAVEDASPSARPVAVSAGYVEVDLRLKRVVVALATTQGEFWANGSYPLRPE